MAKARTTRDRMKQKVEQAENHIETSLAALAEVWETYKEPHPQIAEHLSLIMEGIDTALEALQAFNKTF